MNLELGNRVHSAPAAHDVRQFLSTFIPTLYDPNTAAVTYRPGIDPETRRRAAIDPRTGAVAPMPYIGLFVPGSGNYAPGMAIGGKGAPDDLCIDTQGNLYALAGLRLRRGSSETLDARPGVRVFSPQGKLLRFIADDDRSREKGGMGLGLSIAQRAVRLHLGQIKARSARPIT